MKNKKYEDCVNILNEIHDVIALTLSELSEKELVDISAAGMIKQTIENIIMISKLDDKQIQQLNTKLDVKVITTNTHDVINNEVFVCIPESVTKGIIQ
jgi:hypothetical protein